MDWTIRTALTWVLLGIGAVMTGFTGLDLASGVTSSALWLGLVFWPTVIAISWTILAKDAKKRKHQGGKS